ncbi:MAG: ABC transporter ATP-binding protein [Eubacteriales bacterium]
MIALEAEKICFAYDEALLLSDISIQISEGECVALTGPSGSGKSTLCYILCGVIPRSIDGEVKGKVWLFGDEIKSLSLEDTVERVGIVFQNPDSQLFSPTVEDEIAFGPENMCMPKKEIGKRIEYALETVGMQGYRYANPSHLSGGQKQLVALAAMLALEPKALIFDESMSQLDDESTLLVKNAIQKLQSQGKAILIVEHDAENLDIADRVYKLEGGILEEVDND